VRVPVLSPVVSSAMLSRLSPHPYASMKRLRSQNFGEKKEGCYAPTLQTVTVTVTTNHELAAEGGKVPGDVVLPVSRRPR